MRRTLLTLALCLGAALLTACTPSEQSTIRPAGELDSLAVIPADSSTLAQAAEDSLADWAFSRKTEYIDRMSEELSGIQSELDRLSRELVSSESGKKSDSRDRLDAVRKQWVSAKIALDQVSVAQEQNWRRAGTSFRKARNTLKAAFDKARESLGNTIEPLAD